jgi:hypothetical protein
MAVRDYAMERTLPDGWRAGLWTDVLRRVEPAYVPAPACLLGFAAWRVGFGALALVAVDRALEQDPQYPMAKLLEATVSSGLSPAALADWPHVHRGDFDPQALSGAAAPPGSAPLPGDGDAAAQGLRRPAADERLGGSRARRALRRKSRRHAV